MYHKTRTRVYLADAQPEERSALRLLLLDLNMEVVGEASDLVHHIGQSPHHRPGYAVGGLGLAAG
jgi:DNA-binding NarL/FixJ family response regulator